MYHFIVNPKSSSENGLKKWRILAKLLDKKNISYQVHFTRKQKDATHYAKKITSSCDAVTLIAVGGDGTANEVINGIKDFFNVTFAYIPTGSSNDLARSLHLPTNPEEALKIILNPSKILSCNLGIIQMNKKSRRFIVSSGIGFDAAVCEDAYYSRTKKILNRIHLGKLTYLFIALKQLFILKGSPMSLTIDSGETLTFPRVFFAAFMNTCYEGGGFMFCPDARPDDDFLDICLVEKLSPFNICTELPKAFHGNHLGSPQVHIYRCKEARVKTPHPLSVHTDGEPLEKQNYLRVSLIKEKLPFIVS